MRDLYHNLPIVHLLDAQGITDTSVESDILDLSGYGGACLVVNVGEGVVDASNYVTPVLEESDTIEDLDFSTVDPSDILGGFLPVSGEEGEADVQGTQYVGYIGSKRYLRVLLGVTGDVTTTYVSVDGILGYPASAPAEGPEPITAT